MAEPDVHALADEIAQLMAQRFGGARRGTRPDLKTMLRRRGGALPRRQRKAAQRAALNALRRARRSAEKAGVSLSEWEGEFLDSVGERIETHGRAFADPEKGAPGQALSAMQGRKLKEITAKANGEEPKRHWGRKPKEP